MCFEDELFIAQELQKIPTEELMSQKNVLKEILDAIFISHGDCGEYEVSNATQPQLDKFARWLMDKNKVLFCGTPSVMTSVAEFISEKYEE